MAAVMVLVACSKQEVEPLHERNIVYTVYENSENSENSKTTTIHLNTEEEWYTLLDRFCTFAKEGSTVTFYNANRSAKGSAKKTVEYSTSDREEMKKWMAQMEDQGKTVTITYDPGTGIYHGKAYTTAPQPPMQGRTVTYVNPEFYGSVDAPIIIVTIDSINHTAYVNFDNISYWLDLHMPCGKFDNIREEDGRLILAMLESNTNPSTFDTLFIERRGGDTLLIWFSYGNLCPQDHTHGSLLVPAPQGLETWYCDQVGGIIMHIMPNAIETYPEIHLAQFCAPGVDYINCLCPLCSGYFEMVRYYTNRPGLDWELSLRVPNSYASIDSLGLSGHDLSSDTQDAMPIIIHDIREFPGCESQYVFNKIN